MAILFDDIASLIRSAVDNESLMAQYQSNIKIFQICLFYQDFSLHIAQLLDKIALQNDL